MDTVTKYRLHAKGAFQCLYTTGVTLRFAVTQVAGYLRLSDPTVSKKKGEIKYRRYLAAALYNLSKLVQIKNSAVGQNNLGLWFQGINNEGGICLVAIGHFSLFLHQFRRIPLTPLAEPCLHFTGDSSMLRLCQLSDAYVQSRFMKPHIHIVLITKFLVTSSSSCRPERCLG